MSSGYLFLDASEAPQEPKRRWAATRRMVVDTAPGADDNRSLRYVTDLLRTMNNKLTFGLSDNAEGLVNSLRYGTDFDDAHTLSRMRTERAGERLDAGLPEWLREAAPVRRSAELAGAMGGYLATLPFLPARMVSAAGGWLSPAMAPTEMVRGFLESGGDPYERLQGANRHLLSDPSVILNPLSGKSLGAQMFHAPAMEAAGLGSYTPAAYADRIFGDDR